MAKERNRERGRERGGGETETETETERWARLRARLLSGRGRAGGRRGPGASGGAAGAGGPGAQVPAALPRAPSSHAFRRVSSGRPPQPPGVPPSSPNSLAPRPPPRASLVPLTCLLAPYRPCLLFRLIDRRLPPTPNTTRPRSSPCFRASLTLSPPRRRWPVATASVPLTTTPTNPARLLFRRVASLL